MKAGALPGLLVGLLLVIPLGAIAVYAIRERLQLRGPQERRVSPILSLEERLKRVTYQRDCKKAQDCEPPLGCLSDSRFFKSYCADSECMTDMQCREGFSCQELRTRDDGPRVRACIPQGVRKEGERCASLPADLQQACEPGLLCGAAWCGRPCEKAKPGSCPAGFFCSDVTPGPLCLPTCVEQGCSTGKVCVSFHQGTSACMSVHGVDCRQSGCPGSQECLVLQRENLPGEVWMECATRCGEGRPVCPDGMLCHRSYCQTPCTPESADACAPGYYCGRFGADEPWVCRFDRRRTKPESEPH